MSPAPLVGRILCVNEDGGAQFTAHYGMPFSLRSSELFTEHGVFHQNHQTLQGQWVYKYMRPLGGRPTEGDLTEYRYPGDVDWDGPRSAQPSATWAMVSTACDRLVHAGGASPKEIDDLHQLAYAAFHRLPVPAPPVEVPPAIVDVILDEAPPNVVRSAPPPPPARPTTWADLDGGIREPEGHS